MFVNETHLDQMLVSQVYRCMSGNDYFAKKGGRQYTAGGRGKLEQLLINMSALSLSFF